MFVCSNVNVWCLNAYVAVFICPYIFFFFYNTHSDLCSNVHMCGGVGVFVFNLLGRCVPWCVMCGRLGVCL